MKKRRRRLLLPLTWFGLFVLAGCVPKVTLTQTAHYRLYENLSVTPADAQGWKNTGISIPRGATVAVMAKGRIWDQRVSTWTRHPYQLLWLRVGKEGRKFPVYYGDNREKPLNMNAFTSARSGVLYAWVEIRRFPERKTGSFVVTVIVWPREQTDDMEEDCEELARSHPGDVQYVYLPSFLARGFLERGDYSRAEA
jgi:hypothetical protein